MDPRSPSSPSSSPDHKRPKRVGQFDLGNNKICIVLCCREYVMGSRDAYVEYLVFVVDLLTAADIVHDDRYHLLTPIIRIDCGLYDIGCKDAFCLSGNILYMFEGSLAISEEYASKKSIFSFDLSDLGARTYLKTSLEKICDMCSPRMCPLAIPTPDGSKIVILPTYFHEDSEDFEVFYVTDKTCQLIPRITMPTHDDIHLYGFITKSKLMLHGRTGFYVLDVDSLDKGWEHPHTVLNDINHLFSAFCHCPSSFVTADGFCLATLGGVYDLEDFVPEEDGSVPDWFHDPQIRNYAMYPKRGTDPYTMFVPERAADAYYAYLDHNDDRYNFCELIMEQSRYLLISVCYIDIKKYKAKMKAQPFPTRDEARLIKEASTITVKRMRFSLDVRKYQFFKFPDLISCVCI